MSATKSFPERAPRASVFFARTLVALDRALGETVPRVLANVSADEEALHDFRVEVRKLRT